MHTPEFEYCEQNDTQWDYEREERDEERAIHASLADCSRGKLPGDTRPPVGEEADVHHDVTDYAGKQPTSGLRAGAQPRQTIFGFKRDQISQSCIQISLFATVPSIIQGHHFQKSSLDGFFSEPDGFSDPLGVLLEQRVPIGVTPISSRFSA
jgi:hypothetical protein